VKGRGTERRLARLLAVVLSALFLAGLTTSSSSGPTGPMALSVAERLTLQHGDAVAVLPTAATATVQHLVPSLDLEPPAGSAGDAPGLAGRAPQHQQSGPSAADRGPDRSRAPPLTG
jgi:hypothetical protein